MEQYGEIQIILFVAEKAKLFNGGNENSYVVGISDIRNKIRIGRNKFTVMDGDGAAFFFPANVTGERCAPTRVPSRVQMATTKLEFRTLRTKSVKWKDPLSLFHYRKYLGRRQGGKGKKVV